MNARRTKTVVRVFRVLSNLYRGKGKTASDRSVPFEILISTILSARTRDETTHSVSDELFRRFPTAYALAKAGRRDVERLIRRIGFYRMKSGYVIGASRMLVSKHRGRVPRDESSLLDLPGVGRKTANIVRSYAFDEHTIAVDTHVHRISNRLGWVNTRSPEQTERALLDVVPERWRSTVNDSFVKFGKDVCQPRSPQCWRCPVRRFCRYQPKRLRPAGIGKAYYGTVHP